MKGYFLVLLLIPCVSQASEYSCKGPNGWESMDVKSFEEARYVSQERWHAQVPCVKGDPNDSFDADAMWIGHQNLRPFLPPDIKLPKHIGSDRKGDVDTSSFRCDYSGDFASDDFSDKYTRCSTLESASMGLWKIRSYPSFGASTNTVLWRLPEGKLHGKAQFWVHTAASGVQVISPEALAYAKGRGFDVISGTVATSIGPAGDPIGATGEMLHGSGNQASPPAASSSGAEQAVGAANCASITNMFQKLKCIAAQAKAQGAM